MNHDEESSKAPILTGFTVLVGLDGKAYALANEYPEEYKAMASADLRSIRAACLEIADDILVTQISERTRDAMSPQPDPTFAQRVADRFNDRQNGTKHE